MRGRGCKEGRDAECNECNEDDDDVDDLVMSLAFSAAEVRSASLAGRRVRVHGGPVTLADSLHCVLFALVFVCFFDSGPGGAPVAPRPPRPPR